MLPGEDKIEAGLTGISKSGSRPMRSDASEEADLNVSKTLALDPRLIPANP
jgi:hypothetical protein